MTEGFEPSKRILQFNYHTVASETKLKLFNDRVYDTLNLFTVPV